MYKINLANGLNLVNVAAISNFGPIFKALFLLADFFILMFLLVVLRQIFAMDHIIHDSNDSMFIKTFAFALLFVAASLFLISLAIL